MTFDEYVALAHQHYLKHKDVLRMGQAYVNFLREHRPEIARKVTGTRADPFYKDDVPFDFLLAVAVMW